MRKEIEAIDRPSLTLHIEYDHLTVGEFGNMLVRLQAALRSIAELSPMPSNVRDWLAKPKFITSSVSTEKSMDVNVVVGVVGLALQAAGATETWRDFSGEVFRRFKIAVLAMIRGYIKASETLEEPEAEQLRMLPPEVSAESLSIEVTRGNIDIELSRPFLNELSNTQKRRLANFIRSLIGPARKVDIGDDESEMSIEGLRRRWQG